MNRPLNKFTAADTPLVGSNTGAAREAEARAAPTLCPQCDTPLSDRITDEDTQMSYPCDPGEGFCEACDSLWTDEYLTSPAPSSTLTIEEVEAQIARAFNPLWKPKGYERIEL